LNPLRTPLSHQHCPEKIGDRVSHTDATASGPHQLQAGLLAQVLQFHQVAVAAAEAAGDAIGQGEVLLHQGVTAAKGAASRRSGGTLAGSKAAAAIATARTPSAN